MLRSQPATGSEYIDRSIDRYLITLSPICDTFCGGSWISVAAGYVGPVCEIYTGRCVFSIFIRCSFYDYPQNDSPGTRPCLFTSEQCNKIKPMLSLLAFCRSSYILAYYLRHNRNITQFTFLILCVDKKLRVCWEQGRDWLYCHAEFYALFEVA